MPKASLRRRGLITKHRLEDIVAYRPSARHHSIIKVISDGLVRAQGSAGE